ncbi:MAG: YeaH/YhbH family protein [Inhella sp.]
MQSIIDRRLSGKNKSIGNRERFLRRVKEQVKEAVRRAIDGRSIKDIEKGEDIRIPKKDLSEPTFHHGEGGTREMVRPGNKEFVKGDRSPKPQGGQGQGGGSQASDSGEGEDDFVFHLSREEFMEVFFEDLALPHLVRTELTEQPEWKTHRAGFVSDGSPTNLHVVRSMRGALSRRIALGMDKRRRLQELEEELERAMEPRRTEVLAEIAELKRRLEAIPYLDPIDLRFRNRVRVPVPSTNAVMFCLMDVSGSMDEGRKDLAKRFFILLYLFLTKHYEKVELVFIRHHTQAAEVDEQNFFHATETGGTVVSSALVLMDEIQKARYPASQWNIYGAQASDGDNWHHDSSRCKEILQTQILPMCRYFAYVQVAEPEQNLWDEYSQLADEVPHFAMRKATAVNQIYPVFRDLFRKEGRAAA